MNRSGVLVYATVAAIVGVTVLSGPAVGVVDLTTPRFDTAGLGSGNATVDRVEAPDTVSLDRGFETESYYLKVPDARIHAESVEGKPIVSYDLSIPAMGYSRGTTHFLRSGDEGWITLSLERDTMADGEVTRERYDGILTIVLRHDDTETVLHRGNVSVEVSG